MFSFNTALLRDRPHTPPKEKDTNECIDHAIRALNISVNLEQPSQLQTPPQSSPPPQQIEDQSPSQPLKRLRFHTEPSLCDEIESENPRLSNSQRSLRQIPPSKDLHSSRSILKPFDKPATSRGDGQPLRSSEFESFADMLESVIKQLAGGTQSAKLDAYNVLYNSIKAYDKVPDPEALSAKMPLLEDFVKRDITEYRKTTTFANTKLVVHALKLVAVLMCDTHRMAHRMRRDFIDWLMEDTISILQAVGKSKEATNHQLYLLTLDDFCATAMTGGRARRTLESLVTIHERVSGDAIQCIRLMMYLRLFDHAKRLMAKHLRLWFPVILHGALSGSSEVSKRALEAGAKGANDFGASPACSQTVMDFMHQASSGTGSNFDHSESELKHMLENPAESHKVPQIWSIIILFLRSNARALETWQYSQRWFKIIQQCFNSKDLSLNHRALVAWNQLIRAVHPTPSTRGHLLRTLRQPIVSQLQRTEFSRLGARVREVAVSSSCLLLYYVFCPGFSSEEYTTFWNDFVHGMLSRFKATNKEQMCAAHQVLASLLHDSKLGFWTSDRVRRNSTNPVNTDEVPRLDPQWVRKNIDIVMKTLEMFLGCRCFEATMTEVPNLSSRHALFRSLAAAVDESSAKEVKTSAATEHAITVITNSVLRLIGDDELSQIGKHELRSSYLQCCWGYIDSMATSIRSSILVDRFLYQDDIGFVAGVPAPKHHHPQSSRTLTSPVIALLEEFFAIVRKQNVSNSSIDIEPLLRRCLGYSSSRKDKLSFLRACTRAMRLTGSTSDSSPPICEGIKCIIQLTASTLDGQQSDSRHGNAPRTGREYESVTRILKVALRSRNAGVWEAAENLLNTSKACAKRDAGNSACVLVTFAPLLKAINDSEAVLPLSRRIQCAAWLLVNAVKPSSQQSMNHAYRALWSESPPNEVGSGVFETLCSTTNSLLCAVRTLTDDNEEACTDLLFVAASRYLVSPACLFPEHFLWSIQENLAPWVRKGFNESLVRVSEEIVCIITADL